MYNLEGDYIGCPVDKATNIMESPSSVQNRQQLFHKSLKRRMTAFFCICCTQMAYSANHSSIILNRTRRTFMNRQEKKQKIIDILNQAKSLELQAIHQYMHQHYHLDDKDFGELAANMKLIAIDEMRHAEALAERIKELGGEPTSELAGPVVKGQEVEEIFSFDSEQEDEAMEVYGRFLNICRENGDSITASLFEMIIEHEQEHFNYFSNVDDHIKSLGATYLSRIAGTPASTGPAKGFAWVDKG